MVVTILTVDVKCFRNLRQLLPLPLPLPLPHCESLVSVCRCFRPSLEISILLTFVDFYVGLLIVSSILLPLRFNYLQKAANNHFAPLYDTYFKIKSTVNIFSQVICFVCISIFLYYIKYHYRPIFSAPFKEICYPPAHNYFLLYEVGFLIQTEKNYT